MSLFDFMFIFIIVIATAVTTLICVPYVYRFAKRVGAVAKVNNRSMHKGHVPLLGGLAIAAGFLVGLVLLYLFSPGNESGIRDLIAPLIASILIILFTGFIDDVFVLKPLSKLLLQSVAAAMIVTFAQLQIDVINIGFIQIEFGIFSPIISILWIVTITNAINLIDGLDGLATGISAMSFITLFILATFSPEQTQSQFVSYVSLILFFATAVFLLFNFPPAKMFLGDTGALFLGFMIGVLTLTQYKNAAFFSLVLPLMVFALPLLDMISATLRRLLRKQSPGSADREHLHHKVFNSTNSVVHAVYILLAVNAFFNIVAIIYFTTNISRSTGYIFVFLTIILADLIVEYFQLISPKYRPLLESYQYIRNAFGRNK